MVIDILLNFIYQWIFLLGILLFGCFVAHICKAGYYKLLSAKGYKVSCFLDFIGVPIHEIGHAMMCLPFGFKIKKIVLYKPDPKTNTLGYVTWQPGKNKLINNIGGFFVGIGPIISGSAVLLLLMWLLIPATFQLVVSDLITTTSLNSYSIISIANYYINIVYNNVCNLFSLSNLTNILWYVFLFFAINIARHIALSKADIKNGLKGLGILSLILLIVTTIVGLISTNFQTSITGYCLFISGILMSFICMSIIMNILLILIASLFKITKLILSKKH